jgi:hypothetical protein
MSTAARSSRICVPFSEKLDSLLDCLDNWCTMRDSRNDALEWVSENRNDAQYCSDTTILRL